MPCDTTITNQVDIKASDRTLLKKAIAALKWKITSETSYGTLTLRTPRGVATLGNEELEVQRGNESLADELKVAYSTEVVKATYNRFGWKLNQKSKNKFTAVKQS